MIPVKSKVPYQRLTILALILSSMVVYLVFLNQHGLDLEYPLDENKNINGLAEVIENCAAGHISKDQLMDWFESHKAYLED